MFLSLFSLNAIALIFLFSVLVQLLIYLLVFSRPALRHFHKSSKSGKAKSIKANEIGSDELPLVSVIVCARNEESNLTKNIPQILRQQYPHFELIVVDDCSEDQSAEILSEFSSQDSRVRVIRMLQKTSPGKKAALARGISEASGEILLLTDADCAPASDLWIRTMILCYTPSVEIVLGFGGYTTKPGILNKVIRYETFHTWLQYAGWTIAGFPYMGVGRNLSYRKTVFNRAGGFEAHLNYASGDDDLLVNAVANGSNTVICDDSKAFTWSAPVSTWKGWYRQKTRHVSASGGYRILHQIVLGLYALTHVLTYVTIPLLFITKVPLVFILTPLMARWTVQMVIFYYVLKRITAGDLWYFSTIFDFFAIGYYATLVGSAFTRKNPIWR